ncbi:DUF1501 domain-containing protein [Hymenobacter sp. BT664]|uniref:DUF1501 domain-containing protein n=1 Tax=Hymenobacter montanus TaxID=2771359 RepID=A0A927BFS3_9BACT|nr:DUF1501 domain-containing protein [Hymenobacter montanus]MBD2769621.1 DUF1501 domain-containing protein [Hymenobacter montanus]
MKRRHFLQTTAAATVLPTLLGGMPIGAYGFSPQLFELTGGATNTDRVLVLIELSGGNDGLNTIIPLDQYTNLMRARPNVAIAQNRVLTLRGATGIHPAMVKVKNLFDNGQIGIVQDVGYPEANGSHFRSFDIWATAADSDVTLNSGWAGRYLDGEYPGFPIGYPNAQAPHPLAITIGSVVSNVVQGPAVNMGMAIRSTTSFLQLLTGAVDMAPNTPFGHELTFIRQVVQQTQVYVTAIQQAAARAQNLSPLYPAARQNALADQLKIVAQLVAGGLQTRVYICSLGDFDNHSDQVDGANGNTTGEHATLLGKLSVALDAFQDDLRRLRVQDRVVGMTFSEFGRRIVSNSANGTDHGEAGPMIVFGTSVNPIIHGPNPTIPADTTFVDNLPMQIDFRSVYASILKDWFQVPQATINALLPSSVGQFPYVPVIRQGTVTGSTPAAELEVTGFSVFPNPARERATATFECQGGHVQMVLRDVVGREVRRVLDRAMPQGQCQVPVDVSGLKAGLYYCHVREGQRVSARSLSVL